MEYFVALMMLVVSLGAIRLALSASNGQFNFLGVTGVFSIGYYVLPVFFKIHSGLDALPREDISGIAWMNLIFFIAVISGNFFFAKFFGNKFNGMRLTVFDGVFDFHYGKIYILSAIVWISYFLTADLTSYSAESFEAFFHERGPLDGLLAAFSGFALAGMATSIALATQKKQHKHSLIMLLGYGFAIILLLSTGQRLAVITPIFTLVALYSVFNFQGKSVKLLAVGIVILLVVSPFMVFVREFQGVLGRDKVLAASSSFGIDGDFFDTLLLSIMQRADLIEVSIYLKTLFDSQDGLPFQYYSSILYSLVPSFILPDKPFPLSDDGTIFGEISVVAWLLLHSNSTGSLTAFGAISAYREGGWLWVPFNGLLVGIFFAVIFSFLGRGGNIARWLYGVIFVTACIKNVPPSFFQLFVYMAATINTIVVLLVVDKLLKVFGVRLISGSSNR